MVRSRRVSRRRSSWRLFFNFECFSVHCSPFFHSGK
uniref:Uncharacterized protein n=1 Tax=Arundo donax TaxID=35708 RepID=A0A0A9DLJ7_ARUDO